MPLQLHVDPKLHLLGCRTMYILSAQSHRTRLQNANFRIRSFVDFWNLHDFFESSGTRSVSSSYLFNQFSGIYWNLAWGSCLCPSFGEPRWSSGLQAWLACGWPRFTSTAITTRTTGWWRWWACLLKSLSCSTISSVKLVPAKCWEDSYRCWPWEGCKWLLSHYLKVMAHTKAGWVPCWELKCKVVR